VSVTNLPKRRVMHGIFDEGMIKVIKPFGVDNVSIQRYSPKDARELITALQQGLAQFEGGAA
jgi:hypothetical protein